MPAPNDRESNVSQRESDMSAQHFTDLATLLHRIELSPLYQRSRCPDQRHLMDLVYRVWWNRQLAAM